MTKLWLDLAFYALSALAFYDSYLLSILSLIIIFVLFKFRGLYKVDVYALYLDSFIDFLNQINSGLSSGLSFESSVLQSNKSLEKEQGYMVRVFKHLENAVRYGVGGEKLFDELEKQYPIEECRLYTSMLKLSKKTGASMNKITETVLDNLYMKFKTVSEAKIIVFQKKLEHMILCIAPLIIIFFIRFSSGKFIESLYITFIGKIVMTVAFAFLLIMKIVGRRIVEKIG